MSKVVKVKLKNAFLFLILFFTAFLFVKQYPILMIGTPKQSITITALTENNKKSLGQEVWITNIHTQNSIYDLSKVTNDSWFMKDNSLVFSGSKESTLQITFKTNEDVTVSFMKHPYSGKVKINNNVIDLYSEDTQTTETIIHFDQSSILLIVLYGLAYSCLLIVVFYFMSKNKILLNIIPFCTYLLLMLLIEGEFNIKHMLLFFPMFFSFFIINKNNRAKFSILYCSLIIFILSQSFLVPLNFHITDASVKILISFVNISFITVLLFSGQFFYSFITKYNEKPEYSTWLKVTFLYFTIIILVLLLIWPGNWIWDEKSVFICAQEYAYNSWQSYVMVLIYSWALKIIPFTVGIVIIQSFIFSVIVGYIISKYNQLNVSKQEKVIIIILLCMPPIILNILYPLRTTLYSGIELLFIFQIYYLKNKNLKINSKDLLLFAFCIVILSFIRTEGIYYLILGPLAIIFLFKNQILQNKQIYKFLTLMILMILIYYPLKYLDNLYPNNYVLTALPNPLTIMLQDEKLKITKSEEDSIDKVFSIKLLKENPSYTEITAYHLGAVRPDYKVYFKQFLKTYAKLIMDNPGIYLKARFQTFLATTGLDKNHPNNSPWSYLDERYIGSDKEVINILQNDKFSQPFNYEVRNKIINILKGTNVDDDMFNISGQIIWNFLPMLIILIIYFIYGLVKKNSLLIVLSTLILIKVPIVFVTAPANYFFYYFSIYLIGIFPIGHIIGKFILKIKK